MQQLIKTTTVSVRKFLQTVYTVATVLVSSLAGANLIGLVQVSKTVKVVLGAYLVAASLVVLVDAVHKGSK